MSARVPTATTMHSFHSNPKVNNVTPWRILINTKNLKANSIGNDDFCLLWICREARNVKGRGDVG